MLFTHFGFNNLGSSERNTLTASGTQNNGPGLFIHDALIEFALIPEYVYVGGGLHYWNGLSRLSSQGSINMLTLDAPTPQFNWHSAGTSDQFVRHIGIYLKGQIGRLKYRFSVNDPLIENNITIALSHKNAVYVTRKIYGISGKKANRIWAGYMHFQFLEKENTTAAPVVGTYLGEKRIFNIGAGFFFHPDGTLTLKNTATQLEVEANIGNSDVLNNLVNTHQVSHFAIDAFYDAPLGKGAITTYLAYYNFDYGPNGSSRQASTGNVVHIQAGYLLPKFSKWNFQPYFAFNTKNYQRNNRAGRELNIGLNWFFREHNAKITMEYRYQLDDYSDMKSEAIKQIRFQAQVLL